MVIGLQLYSVRSLFEKDVDSALALIASIGYKTVETAGYYGLSASEFAAKLAQHGLRASSSHVGLDQMLDNPEKVAADAKALGIDTVMVPWLDPSSFEGGWEEVAEKVNAACDNLSGHGITVGYHNHDFELKGEGVLPLELLMGHVDPKVATFELDLAWVHIAGHDPVAWLGKFEGQLTHAHFKDVDANGKFVSVGHGVQPWDAIIAKCKERGITYCIAENDNPDDCEVFLRESFAFLQSKGISA